MKKIGATDKPKLRLEEDTLNISPHVKALKTFIERSETPITIGIQGEWGSGKTTLTNMIYTSIDEESDKNNILQVWVNAWEFSLLSEPEETLVKVLNEIINQMAEHSSKPNQAKKIFTDKVLGIGKGALRVAAGMTAGREGAAVAREWAQSGYDSITGLRDEVSKLSKNLKKNGQPVKKIVIYIDDLDRINPPNAVSLLELLKNVFDIAGCIFILAIDYQVVVKGLKEKFGETMDFEEWEFKAFFDKIIQLPFTMPTTQYDIGSYVTDLLIESGFLEKDQHYEDEIKEIISYTIGGNPRSIKRLVNSLTLIDIFTEKRDDVDDIFDDENLLVISLVCLQIEYPSIYSLLIVEPNFRSWTQKNTAFSITKRKEEEDKKKFKEDLRIASLTNEFNEEWEKALFRICYNKPQYAQKAESISRLLTFIDKQILKEKNASQTTKGISRVINKTFVTSISEKGE